MIPATRSVAKGATRSFHSSRLAASWWGHIEPAPKDPILGVTEAFLADRDPTKMNVGVGAYRDDNGKPVVLNCVREAEKRIAGKEFMEYAPMGGLVKFNDLSIKLAYGENAVPIAENRVAAVQALSGTGACRLFAEFQKRFHPNSEVLWQEKGVESFLERVDHHHNIWKDAGVPEKLYRYYKAETRGLDLEGLKEDLEAAKEGSFILLHACAHNPTGVDPTPDQWKEISALMKRKGLFALFDMAYQGFASGDTDRDAQAIRIFLEDGHQVACAQSFAKNMGLYGQRIGCLSVITGSEKEAVAVKSQLQQVARPMYSNPPVHGALLVHTVLHDQDLKNMWHGEVKMMADRIISMRSSLRHHLEEAGSKGQWNHITDQIGMFCFSGLTPDEVDRMTREYHVYMTRNGRISMAGITSKNVEYLATAIHEVTK